MPPTKRNFPRSRLFNEGEHVWAVAGRACHPAVIVSVENNNRTATVRWSTWKSVGRVEVAKLRRMFDELDGVCIPSSFSRRERRLTKKMQEMTGRERRTRGGGRESHHHHHHSRHDENGRGARCRPTKDDDGPKFDGPNNKMRRASSFAPPAKEEATTAKANPGRTRVGPNRDIQDEYDSLWEYYMEPRTRENEEIAGSGMVLRKKIACCSLLRSKNDVFRRKVHGRVMRLRKMGGDIADIHRILNLMREHDSGKLPKDELCRFVREILGPAPRTFHDEVEVLDSLAASALQRRDKKIEGNEREPVGQIASSGLTEPDCRIAAAQVANDEIENRANDALERYIGELKCFLPSDHPSLVNFIKTIEGESRRLVKDLEGRHKECFFPSAQRSEMMIPNQPLACQTYKTKDVSTSDAKKRSPIIHAGDVGFEFCKEFDSGWFNGRVAKIRPNAKGGKDRRCVYDDGDMEDLSLADLTALVKKAKKRATKRSIPNDGSGACFVVQGCVI